MDTKNCTNPMKMYHEPDTFHIGGQGKIHFTETHEDTVYSDFCIDHSYTGGSPWEEDYEADIEEHGYTYVRNDENSTYYSDDYNYEGCINHNYDKEHQMVAVFCDHPFTEIQKCCDTNENLNLRYIPVTRRYSVS